MKIQTEDQIGAALAARSKHFTAASLKLEGDAKSMALLLALHSSLAGWVLTQATAVQALEIFEKYRPPVNRN